MKNKRFKGCWRLVSQCLMRLMSYQRMLHFMRLAAYGLITTCKIIRALDKSLSAGRVVLEWLRNWFENYFS